MLNHKSTRSARLFWLGALLGAAVFLLVYGLAPLDVANDAFCRGGYIEKDIQQHYAGWLFYRSSAPGWPLGVTQAINAPQGVSVAYTDSIPLLAVLCRPLAAALGGTFQYFGWFTLVCFALQGGFAALLCGLFAEGLAAPLAGSLVFAASPILLERAFRHTSLGAQWLVLAALYCYFVCRRQSRFASRGLFVINILAVGIHPYFLPMTYAVTLALLLEYAVKQRQWLRPALFLGGNMLCTAALGWALGLLYGTATSGGQALYGYFAMNLNALPVEYDDLASEQGGESSADVRARVMAARALQRERYKALPGVRFNAQLPSGALRRYCRMTPAAEKILRSAFERLGYSARAYDRILRVARTVADLDGSEVLDTAHLSETLQYRTLDRKFGM